MPVKIGKKMSKAAAIKASRNTASKRKTVQSKPASKKAAKPKKSATVAPKKKVTALTVDPKRQARAIEIDGRMFAAVRSMISGSEEVVEIASEMEKGGHWKDLPEKFTSFTAWMNKYAEQAHVSIRTLKGGISFAKATPQLTAAQRKNIGPRKGAKITAAAKAAEAKGQTLDPEILEKAVERTEEEVRADLVERGLIIENPEAETGHDDSSFEEMRNVLSGSATGQFYFVPEAGHPESSELGQNQGRINHAEDVPHATPEDFAAGSVIHEAVEAYRAIWPNDAGMDKISVTEQICEEWLKTQCLDDVRFPNQTNAQAADSLKPKKNGKRKK